MQRVACASDSISKLRNGGDEQGNKFTKLMGPAVSMPISVRFLDPPYRNHKLSFKLFHELANGGTATWDVQKMASTY